MLFQFLLGNKEIVGVDAGRPSFGVPRLEFIQCASNDTCPLIIDDPFTCLHIPLKGSNLGSKDEVFQSPPLLFLGLELHFCDPLSVFGLR